jgi:glycosyltransferase involved in cell wall biosynthesis
VEPGPLTTKDLTEPRRVLYVIGGGRVGGTETHLFRLLASLDRTKFLPIVCCLNGDYRYRSKLTTVAEYVENLQIDRFDRPRGLGAYIGALSRLISKWKPDVVQTYGYACDISVPIVARLASPGVRVITTRRGEDQNPRHQQLRQLSNLFVDTVVCVSSTAARFAEKTEKLNRQKLSVIPNGVPTPECARSTGMRRDILKFGALGTIKPIKGIDLLVDAFLQFDKNVRAELWIAGGMDRTPEWADAIARKAKQSHLAHRIKFLGHQHEPLAFLNSIDVFVLPSRSEGMSNALLEAMSLGLPCIATDVGSNRELLQGGREAGIVCHPTADDIFEGMKRMDRATEDRERFGKAARDEVAAKYSLERMVTAYEELYGSFWAWQLQREVVHA